MRLDQLIKKNDKQDQTKIWLLNYQIRSNKDQIVLSNSRQITVKGYDEDQAFALLKWYQITFLYY